MKKTVLIGLFIFSLALNLAVAATLGWHLWKENRAQVLQGTPGKELSEEDIRQIRNVWLDRGPAAMMETRRKIMEKQLELLDQIARNPGRPEAATQRLNELTALKVEMEKEAVARISHTLAALPQDKREAFMTFLKTRSCMGPGMGMRHRGRGGMGPCPVRAPVGE